ncbi:hypothetical protein AURANDRAFT_6846, partial [Aureococcus anophagefferens]
YEEAVELGSVDAMKCLGDIFGLGKGVKMNRTKAKKFYRMAAIRGHPQAQHNIGVLLTHPSEVSEGDSAEEGLLHLINSAAQGYTPAECMLGRCYCVGIGCEVDLQKSYFWYSRAAAKGD